MGKKLTDKQDLFCQEYLVDLNATQAAIRAGYSEKTARQGAAQLLSKINVQERIAELKAARSERLEITHDRVLREYAALGFSNVADYLTFGPDGISVIPSEAIDREKLAAVSEVSETHGGVRIKLHDKLRALDAIADHIDFKRQQSGEGPVTIVFRESRGKDG